MKKEPILVVMAAGMGSRYGSLKQIDPVGMHGEILMDYSLYDAKRAGFKRVIFIIKPEMEEDFKQSIGSRLKNQMEVSYVYQEICNLPKGFEAPKDRVKPWGTGHAVLSCRQKVDAPFAVINADDYYGRQSYEQIYSFLCNEQEIDSTAYAMAGYVLSNTLTENGFVSRGVCDVKNGYLTAVVERTKIEKHGDAVEYAREDGTFEKLDAEAVVSMNLWGFAPSIMKALEDGFVSFLKEALKTSPLKAEYFLPSVVNELISSKKASVKVLPSFDKWYGMTYHEDKQRVSEALRSMTKAGKYPELLWDNQ